MKQEKVNQDIVHHYKVETELVRKLRNSSREERRELYKNVYNELFRFVPNHPQLTDEYRQSRKRIVNTEIKFIKGLLSKEKSFLEVGAGDCLMSNAVA